MAYEFCFLFFNAFRYLCVDISDLASSLTLRRGSECRSCEIIRSFHRSPLDVDTAYQVGEINFVTASLGFIDGLPLLCTRISNHLCP